ncbi:MAG TPA: hypothetical protein DHW15_07170 [Bacteroidetes bacterium]|jgi:hypothetical protein|nr:MAG: hypothetical protein ABR94_08285 [Sphingobacteriales bacterium BACL12 MAG-120802-bin5]KRP12649.1 MAG: hypothetical protein ABR95_02930 [Sphingobacteriales bacterium BACL12 MAG-120813-bin55]HCK21932.1 hypothetical protein [Bacteroidota bacterium]
MQTIIHYFLHFGFPFFIAYLGFRKDWKKVYLILLATMLVDIDHLLASPIFEAHRCSIQFHPLHTWYAMVGYVVLLFFKRPYNIIGIGLLFHMLTDLTDCMMTYAGCPVCLEDALAIGLLRLLAGALGIH